MRLSIKGISYSQTQNGAYALLLSETNGERQLPIVIGAFEAQSIAIALEKDIRPPRPLTHDLFKNFADSFGVIIKQVIIHKLVDGVFYSSLVCERDKIEEIIDSRTSDAVALALRFDAPIFTYKSILDKAGIELRTSGSPHSPLRKGVEVKEDTPSKSTKPSGTVSNLKNKSLAQLEKELDKAVANEDYEKAAKIRDEISRRES